MNIRSKLRDLPFWTIHGVIAAAPSYFWAYVSMQNEIKLETHLGMIAGIVIIIFIYSLTTSTKLFSIRNNDSQFSRALRLAAHLRISLALIFFVIFGVATQWKVYLKPVEKFVSVLAWIDLLPGILALSFIGTTLDWFGLTGGTIKAHFFPVLLTTLTTGAIFSVGFLLLAFAVLILRKLAVKAVVSLKSEITGAP